MSVNTLRLLDKYPGLILCWIFTFCRFISYLLHKKKSLPSPKKILIIKLSEMGSTIFVYPAVSELKKKIPNSEIFFLVFEHNREILDEMNITSGSNIFTVNVDNPTKLFISIIQLFFKLRKISIDTTIDMDFFSRLSASLAFIVCRGNRIGFHKFTNEGLSRGKLLTHPVMYSPHIHTSIAFLSLSKSLFEKSNDFYYKGVIEDNYIELFDYKPSDTYINSVKSKLLKSGVKLNNKLIIINPNSSDIFPLRKWPLNSFAELCKQIINKRSDIYLILTGTKSERADAIEIIKQVQDDRCINFMGMTSLKELLALYSISELMITNDSGPAHFSSLLQLPTIVLFGPETPTLYKPLNKECRCLYSNFTCSPCVSVYNGKKSPCKDNLCLKAISVKTVLDETMKIIETRP